MFFQAFIFLQSKKVDFKSEERNVLIMAVALSKREEFLGAQSRVAMSAKMFQVQPRKIGTHVLDQLTLFVKNTRPNFLADPWLEKVHLQLLTNFYTICLGCANTTRLDDVVKAN